MPDINFYHSFDELNIKGKWDLDLTIKHLEQIPVRGKTLLDVACRDGWYSKFFEDRGAIVTGIDWEDTEARSYIHDYYKLKTKFIHKNLYSLKNEPSNQFDIVFTGDVLCHLENPLGAIKNLHWIAKEKVYIVADIFNRFKVLDPGYIWMFTEDDIIRLMELAGLKNVIILDRYKITSRHYSYLRDVTLFQCDVDPLWSHDNLEEIIIDRETTKRNPYV
jgi:SAM-dependent methyltransferase